MNIEKDFTERELDRIIEMAWEDRTPFEAIEFQFKVTEDEVIKIMQREMKASSFRMWRARVQGRKTKHAKLRPEDTKTFKSSRQKSISQNKISKR
ncbi:TIGR03643 family protein [Mesonia ostreae]|uniref:TIGR03643 family protein n=1 Tax=Mesonia ostreae TaxID=861110 RepID=A0ABU2KLQ6_9FLAO|nr:TIGR03643 family protein [Mesonia ostreae]MDT0295630.1 TIGR03643 family protein [Mesonia ostreae]